MSTPRRYQTLPNLRALKKRRAKERDGGGLLEGFLSGAEAFGRHVGGFSSFAGGAFSFLGGTGGGGGGGVMRKREGSYSFYHKGTRSSSEDPLPQPRHTPRRDKLECSLTHHRGHSLSHVDVQNRDESILQHPPAPRAGGRDWEDGSPAQRRERKKVREKESLLSAAASHIAGHIEDRARQGLFCR
ncbi:hypothetical protein E2C01_017624 [Portunus trituberculatus]|uniref:Uncharacterized protein n=1 Tax=Portunus trituberculatus TaxID=210409 RepID=A0A5B7DSG1_PORTR|nr:hypothetical protein [Portunus trituberculatus]